MEKVLKVFPVSRWPIVQNLMLGIIGLAMFLVFKRSGWDLSTAISLATSGLFCFTFYRGVQRKSREATTAKERLDANWPLMELTIAVVSVLVLCLTILKH
jgi:ribose/xylose/arabinose/galactoside ABC-type transport system permease subunit